MQTLDHLSAQLDRLAAWDAGPFPIVSLYLNLQPDDRGRDRFEPFLRHELAARIETYKAHTPERASLDRDAERIRSYVDGIDPSANGLALFTSSGANLFEAIVLAAPVSEHRLFIAQQPHLYSLALLLDEYPKYAALVADTHAARILVFAGNAVEREADIVGMKTKHHKMGGTAQNRYQRHMENFHLHHAKEVADVLTRIVRGERISTVFVAGNEVILPLLKERFPKDVAERVADVANLDLRSAERDICETTIAALRKKDAASDRERVEALLEEYRASGLACVGAGQTRKAVELGQVDELLLPVTRDDREANAFVVQARRPPTHACTRRLRSALSLASRSIGSVIFLDSASDFSSSFALLWSWTIRLPEFLT